MDFLRFPAMVTCLHGLPIPARMYPCYSCLDCPNVSSDKIKWDYSTWVSFFYLEFCFQLLSTLYELNLGSTHFLDTHTHNKTLLKELCIYRWYQFTGHHFNKHGTESCIVPYKNTVVQFDSSCDRVRNFLCSVLGF